MLRENPSMRMLKDSYVTWAKLLLIEGKKKIPYPNRFLDQGHGSLPLDLNLMR